MANLAFIGEFRALEEALWAEIARKEPLSRLTVVAPAGRLVRRLKIEAARRFPGGLLGVRFANLFQVALELVDVDYRPEPLLAERILSRFGHPSALRAAVRDLKDAGVAPDAGVLLERLREAIGEETGITAYQIRKFGDLLSAYLYYERERERLGFADLPDVFRLAAERAGRLIEPLFVYGFYDCTQVQADFLLAAARHVPVTLFSPDGGPFGRWFRERVLSAVASRTETVEAPPPPRPEVLSAVGERDEVLACAKEIRRLLDEGVPAGEIAFAARTLDAYLPHIEAIFRESGIPAATLPGRPLAAHPLAGVTRSLFRAPLDDLPRAAVLDVVLHPLFKADGDRRHWDYLARALRIGRGDDWERLRNFPKGYSVRAGREDDEDHRERLVPGEDVRALHAAVRRIARRPAAARWAEHAASHRALLSLFDREAMTPDEAAAFGELRAILDRVAALDVLDERAPLAEFLDVFERELDRARLPRPETHGVAVVDAMGLRGLSFRHVFIAGLNARAFPRFIVEEPYVSDSIRRHVLRVLGHHLPVRQDGYDEERLLFRLALTAGGRVVCLYQRADSEGRLRDPSPLLRPFLPAIPVPRVLRARRRPAHAPALAFFERLRSAELTEFEGRTGPVREFAALSPTALENYAGCPFRFFAQHVLRLFPHDERDEGDDLTPMEIGILEHLMLEALYRKSADFVADASARFEKRTGIALRGLLAARRDQAARFVRAFAEWEKLGDWTPEKFEEAGEARLAGVAFRVKMDRIDRGPQGLRVIDYKRRNAWTGRLGTKAKNAEKLQAPLYLEATGAVEAVFPFIEDYTTEDPELGEPVARMTADEWDQVRPEVEKTVATLVASMREGWFFIRPDERGHCRSCDYAAVCRKQMRGLARRAESANPEYWEIVG